MRCAEAVPVTIIPAIGKHGRFRSNEMEQTPSSTAIRFHIDCVVRQATVAGPEHAQQTTKLQMEKHARQHYWELGDKNLVWLINRCRPQEDARR